ncbi:hypothetical protein GCM10027403_10780 [Arthrobacter tecti]
MFSFTLKEAGREPRTVSARNLRSNLTGDPIPEASCRVSGGKRGQVRRGGSPGCSHGCLRKQDHDREEQQRAHPHSDHKHRAYARLRLAGPTVQFHGSSGVA